MNAIESINKAVIDLWESQNFENNAEVYMPSQYPEMDNGELLFVGLNPALPRKNKVRFLEQRFPAIYESYPDYFLWRNRQNFKMEIAAEIESCARGEYSYYDEFNEIKEFLEANASYVDLFFWRQTDQDGFIDQIYTGTRNTKLKDFEAGQLKLSVELISSLQPKLILVANAEASRILARELNVDLEKDFDDDFGCHKASLNGHKCYVYFSSVFTYMGRPARQRLKWHLAKCWKAVNGQIS